MNAERGVPVVLPNGQTWLRLPGLPDTSLIRDIRAAVLAEMRGELTLLHAKWAAMYDEGISEVARLTVAVGDLIDLIDPEGEA